MNIKIYKNKNGNLLATTGCVYLFQFAHRVVDGVTNEDGAWYFWLNGDFDPTIIKGKEFPMEYFENSCRAKGFIYLKMDTIPQDVEIVEGYGYLS